MSYVIVDSCIQCKYTDCVEVCPVDCFHEGPNFMVIDPEECIDCGLCVPECPVEAIKPDVYLTDSEQHFIEINAQLSLKWPVLSSRKAPLPTASEYKDKKDKFSLLNLTGQDKNKD